MRRSDLPVAVADPFHMGHVAFCLDRSRQRVQMFAVAQRDFNPQPVEIRLAFDKMKVRDICALLADQRADAPEDARI